MTRRATIRTTHDDPALVAAALAPDNTEEMTTECEGDAVRTRIEREGTGGLHSTVDDYVVNVDVATTVAQRARQRQNEGADSSAESVDDGGTTPVVDDAPATRADADASDSDDQSNHE